MYALSYPLRSGEIGTQGGWIKYNQTLDKEIRCRLAEFRNASTQIERDKFVSDIVNIWIKAFQDWINRESEKKRINREWNRGFLDEYWIRTQEDMSKQAK